MRPRCRWWSSRPYPASRRAGQRGASSARRCSGQPRYLRAAVGARPFGTIDLHVGLPDAFNLRSQHLATLCTSAAQSRIAPLRGVTPVAGRGDLQDFVNRLDPIRLAVLVDELSHDLKRRSSSAWAKNALAKRRISFALRSSLFSRSTYLFVETTPYFFMSICHQFGRAIHDNSMSPTFG